MRLSPRPFLLIALIALVLSLPGSTGLPFTSDQTDSAIAASYIVQAESTDGAAQAVLQAGGKLTRRLALINAVTAVLDQAALYQLQQNRRITLHADGAVYTSDAGTPVATYTAPSTLLDSPIEKPKAGKETDTAGYLLYPAAATGAQLLHKQTISTVKSECSNRRVTTSTTRESRPLQGWGVTVAVIDSGFMQMKKADDWKFRDATTGTLVAESGGRCIVYRDFLPRSVANENAGSAMNNSTDQNGHGTHVASTIADNRTAALAANLPPTPVGVAPQVNLLVARALDKDGAGSYSDVIAAIEWVIANQATYNVRVLNLSLYAPVTGPYWADPLNQAVMKAWQSGITVVVAAGNSGPDAATITVPGNVPYVITVGALKSGRYTESGDDELAFYSSRGPTESAFVKPDVLVPASRTIAPMPIDSVLAAQVADGRIADKAKVDYKIGSPAKEYAYYQLSGTSMAAAEISGIVALVLQANPTLTNDQVKYRLLATARAAIDDATGAIAYSPWEQGAGLVNTQDAVFGTTTERANSGMDLGKDLDPQSTVHYWGYSEWNDASQTFQLIDPATGTPVAVWSGAGRTWAGAGRTWAGAGRTWAGAGRTWAGAGRTWAGGTTTWAGSDSMWAGAGRTWAGSTPETGLSTASQGELLTNEDFYRAMLPAVRR